MRTDSKLLFTDRIKSLCEKFIAKYFQQSLRLHEFLKEMIYEYFLSTCASYYLVWTFQECFHIIYHYSDSLLLHFFPANR